MSELSPEKVVRGLWSALNSRDYARAAGAIAEHCEWTSMATGVVHRGPSPIVAGLREFVTAFPDWHAELERLTAAGEVVIVEWDSSGTFERLFRGKEPNGKKFRRRGCSVAEVKGGKIVRYKDYYDRLSLLEDLDLMDLIRVTKP